MCGIAGIIKFDGSKVDHLQLKEMCSELIHRGPDAEGLWSNNNGSVGFGHRRLSIIDLTSSADQPMHYAENRYTLVFNGEIYNYVELKSTLTRHGYQFNTNSDTEVLLALYDRKKEKCLEHIDGMFAFAIWDEQEQELFCARDRFGEKPFFYFRNEECLVFASEIKALRKVIAQISVDKNLVQRFLKENYKTTPEQSYFTDVIQLPAAHYLRIKNNNVEIKKYWEIALNRRTTYIRTSRYQEQFYALFSRSVTRRLRSDVKVGSSLSGGLDSSAVVCCIHQLQHSDFSTFSARFPDSPGDEGKWIEEVIAYTGIANYQIAPDADQFIEQLNKIIYSHEFPVASTSVYAQWCVMQLARNHGVKVLLDGQGADEFLAGYDNLKYFALWELYRKGKIMQFRKEVQFLKENFGRNRSVGLKFIYDPLLQLFGRRRKIYDKGYTLKERLKYAVEFELPELLRYADRNSMGNSIEVRLPFLSPELVEFAFSLPPEQIYQKGRTKYVLREAVKNILPQNIYMRKDKIGFAPPENSWMQRPSFKAAVAAATDDLRRYGLQPGPDDFRNLIAARFITLFS
jgi:asparagine synthase (glutamine-hydrolysing)